MKAQLKPCFMIRSDEIKYIKHANWTTLQCLCDFKARSSLCHILCSARLTRPLISTFNLYIKNCVNNPLTWCINPPVHTSQAHQTRAAARSLPWPPQVQHLPGPPGWWQQRRRWQVAGETVYFHCILCVEWLKWFQMVKACKTQRSEGYDAELKASESLFLKFLVFKNFRVFIPKHLLKRNTGKMCRPKTF